MWTKNLRIRVAEDGSLQDFEGLNLQIPELRPGIYEMVCVLQAIPQEAKTALSEDYGANNFEEKSLESGNQGAQRQALIDLPVDGHARTESATMAQVLGLAIQDLRLQGSHKDSFEAPPMQIAMPSEGIDPFAESGLA